MYLGDVEFPSGASGTDDEMFGKEKTLPLSLFLQGQRAQSASGDLPFLAHRHLDQRTCGGGVVRNINADEKEQFMRKYSPEKKQMNK